MKQFSKSWISSKKPGKQRKYRANAPFHLKRKMLSSQLSKELKTKYKKKSLPLRKGDKVKIVRGQFKKLMGKVIGINRKKLKVYVESAQLIKKDGSKTAYPISPSNVVITEINLDDRKRKRIVERKHGAS